MLFVTFFTLLGLVVAGRLPNNYLPPLKSVEATPQSRPAPIISLEVDNHEDGNYHYAYQSGDGTIVEEESKHGRNELQAPLVRGSFSFIAPDGIRYSVSYTADENGFQPHGTHLPTPLPLSEAIRKSLEENSNAANDHDDGQYHEEAKGKLAYLPPTYQHGY